MKNDEDKQAFRRAYLDSIKKRPKSPNLYEIKSRRTETLEGVTVS